MGILRWLLRRTAAQKDLERDAVSYRELRKDIADLYHYSAEFPQITATCLWLLRADDVRRWQEDSPPILSSQWWGPPETFGGQLRARFKKTNRL